jgi:myo-inositol-1(or 4)-monophosphatase
LDGNRSEWAETLTWTTALTAEAGRMASEMLARGTTIHQKADGSTVTDIDRDVERFLREQIAARFPGHAILGEEYGYDARGNDDAPLWALDPIDGTTNLANGLPVWCVSVGLIVGREPVVGVICAPPQNQMYAAAKGCGATLNDQPLPILPPGGPTTWEDTYSVCATSARTMDFSRVPARLRVYGSSALELCWLASGWFKAAQSIGATLYDVAAGLCIAREAGAEAGWLSGDPFDARQMVHRGKHEHDALLCAPPATLAFLRCSLALAGI